jgi:transposase
MEDKLLHEIFGVSKSYRSTRTEVKQGGVLVAVEPLDKLYVCPECGSREVIRRGRRLRRVQTLPIGFHPVFLEVEVPRCQCKACQRLFEIAPPFARPTRTTPKR